MAQNNAYIADPGDMNEMARLIRQDRLVTDAMGEIFSDEVWSALRSVLDIACGPGGWCLDMAREHPHVQVTGVDNNVQMIKHANLLAHAEGRRNVRFLEMDATERFLFPDKSFNMVNLRLASSFTTVGQWPTLFRECLRLLTTGGICRCTELEASYTNSVAYERLNELFLKVYQSVGRSFSPSGRCFGTSFALPSLMQETGFVAVGQRAFSLNYSHDMPDAEGFREDFTVMNETFREFITRTGIISRDEYIGLVAQARQDMDSPRFRAISYLSTIWGVKPETPSFTNTEEATSLNLAGS